MPAGTRPVAEELDVDPGELLDELLDDGSGTPPPTEWPGSTCCWMARCLPTISRRRMARVAHITPDLVAIDWGVDELRLGGGTMLVRFPFDDTPGADERGSFLGPEGWLAGFSAREVVAFRRAGDGVEVERAELAGSGDAEAVAIRHAFDARLRSPEAGMEPFEPLLDAMVDDPTLFRTPAPPLAELLVSTGLELRGAYIGLAGEPWEPPGVLWGRRRREAIVQQFGFEPCCTDAFERALDAWHDHVLHGVPPAASLTEVLAHGSVAPALVEWVLAEFPRGSPNLAGFGKALVEQGRGSAPGHFLLALNAEREGETLAAEQHLESATRADSVFGPALAELARYVADRGDGPRALSLLRRAGVGEDDPRVEILDQLFAPPTGVGRNDPCPCGSGRKFKQCCQSSPRTPDAQRVQWLVHKLVQFTVRPPRRASVVGLASSAVRDDFEIEDLAAMVNDPFIVDLAVMEGGGAEQFLLHRGVLLPAEEREVIEQWIDTDRRLWEVVAVDRGSGVTLRDTKTAEVAEVTDRTASNELEVGDQLLAMAVPGFGRSWLVGMPLRVNLRLRPSLLELLDDHYDADLLAEWYGASMQPPQLANRESEPLVFCTARLRPGDGGWEALTANLDRLYERQDVASWAEMFEVEPGERIIRATLHREDDELVVETNSEQRLERVIGSLPGTDIAGEVERSPVRDLGDMAKLPHPPGDDLPPLPEEVTATVAEQVEAWEDRWLDESIPALDGTTPRQAADDPTRREDLLSLLRCFERIGPPSTPGSFGFDPARLRRKLGLTDFEGR